MTNGLDHLLRQAIGDLADEGKPTNLTRPAIAGARRVRRRRVAGSALAVALVAGLVVATPHLLLRPGPAATTVMGTPTTSTPAATTAAPSPVITRTAAAGAPVDLPDGWVVVGASDNRSALVLDRARNRYVTINGEVLPAPTGTRVALIDANALSFSS